MKRRHEVSSGESYGSGGNKLGIPARLRELRHSNRVHHVACERCTGSGCQGLKDQITRGNTSMKKLIAAAVLAGAAFIAIPTAANAAGYAGLRRVGLG